MSLAIEFCTLPERSYDEPVTRAAAPERSAALLERHVELDLIRKAQAGDSRAQQRLVEANLRLVHAQARRYRCRSHSLEDLVQEGVVGLVMAIRRFDPHRGCRLSTYALHWVRQAIARAAEYNDRLIHLPAEPAAELRRLRALRDDLRRELRREPSDHELADVSGVPEERVQSLLGLVQDPVSLETLVGDDSDASLSDFAPDPDSIDPEDNVVLEACRREIQRLVSRLGPRERQVVEERFGLGGKQARTLDELSRQMRISREGVRQIEVRAIRKLRRALDGREWA
jgi:RNA polymerase primary sigma factor